VLGRGTFGSVLLVYKKDDNTKRRLALKLISKEVIRQKVSVTLIILLGVNMTQYIYKIILELWEFGVFFTMSNVRVYFERTRKPSNDPENSVARQNG
jgi:hypothetical protein